MLARAATGAALGAIIGWATDYGHVGLVTYKPAPMWLGIPWWAHLQYLSAGVAIALALRQIEPRLAQHPSTRPAALLAELGGFLLLYYAPLWAGPWTIPLMAAILLARLLVWGTPPDLLLALVGWLPGTLVEWCWTQVGIYHYVSPGWTTVPLWLPLVWAYLTVLSRRCCLLLPS